MPRGKKKLREPKGQKYKMASAFDTGTQIGRARLWHERLRQAKEVLQIDALRKEIDECKKLIDGSKVRPDGQYNFLNEGHPAIEDLIFSTIPKLPPTEVEARQVEQEDLAHKVEALIDSTLNSGLCNALEAIIELEWDEIYWGIAIGKTPWVEHSAQQPYRPTSSPDYLGPQVAQAELENAAPEEAGIADGDDHLVHIQAHEQARMLYAEDPALSEALDRHIDNHWASVGTQSWAHPDVQRVAFERFLYDPYSETWRGRAWNAELCDELVSVLQQVPGIRNLNPENCPPLDEFNYLHDSQNAQGKEQARRSWDYESTRVQVWKIQDRVNNRYILLPARPGKDIKPLLEIDWPYGSMELYKPIIHRPVPGQIRGHSTLLLIEVILYELARTNKSIQKHVRRAAKAKMIGARGTMEQKDINAIESDRAFEAVNPEAAASLTQFNPPKLPAELLQYRETLLAELRRMLGSDILHQGGDTPHRISATEADLRAGYQQSRIVRRQQIVSEFLSWVAGNIVILYRSFSDKEIPVRVMGAMGVKIQRLDPAAIPDDIIVRLDIYAADEDRKRQSVEGLLKAIEVATQAAPGVFNIELMLRDTLEAMGFTNPAKYILPPEERMLEAGGAVSLGSMASDKPQLRLAGPKPQGPEGAPNRVASA
jgi:hypothetical protein